MKRALSFIMVMVTSVYMFFGGINASAITYETIQQRYDKVGLKPIQSIIDRNAEKISSPNNYDPMFVVEYVADTKDYNDVINTLSEVKRISDDICRGIDDNYEKLRVIYKYVCENIAYDFDAAHNAVTFDVICLKNVLANRRTTCAGFSNLFSALCQAQGFEVVNIRGSAPEGDITHSNLDDETAPMNHEWTAVKWGDEWLYMDCTWDSHNRYEGGEFEMEDNTMLYFSMALNTVSVEHKAHIVDYRYFFEAPKAFTNGHFGTTTPTITTPPTDTSSINTDTQPPNDIIEPEQPPTHQEPISPSYEEEAVTEITTKMPLPETWKATTKTANLSDNSSNSSVDETLETLEETTTQDPANTTLKDPVNTNFAGIDWMKPSEKLEPYIIVVMVLGLGSAIAIALTIGMKKKK